MDIHRNPQTDSPDKIKDFVNEKGDETGYWTKLSDDTWTYTCYVTKTDVPWHVWEDALDGYVSSNSETNPLVIQTGTDEAVITNYVESEAKNETGSLALTNRVVDSTGADVPSDAAFRFAITLTQKDGSVFTGINTYGDLAFNNGKAAVTMTAGQTMTMTDIPDGTQYAITETSIPDGYSQKSFAESSGTIKAMSNTEAVCVNTKAEAETPGTSEPEKTGGFTLTKSCPEDPA